MMSSTQPYRERERAGDRERDPGYNRSRGGPGGGFRGRGGPGGQNKPRRYWDNDEYYKDERVISIQQIILLFTSKYLFVLYWAIGYCRTKGGDGDEVIVAAEVGVIAAAVVGRHLQGVVDQGHRHELQISHTEDLLSQRGWQRKLFMNRTFQLENLQAAGQKLECRFLKNMSPKLMDRLPELQLK